VGFAAARLAGMAAVAGAVLAAALAAAVLPGCGAPVAIRDGQRPIAPTGAQVAVRLRLAVSEGREIQAQVRRNTRADIDYVRVTVLTAEPQVGLAPAQWPEQAVLNHAGRPVEARVDRSDLSAEIVFGNLAPSGRYRFRAHAFKADLTDSGTLISTAASFLDLVAAPPGGGEIPRIPVILADTPFAARTGDSPIVVEDGQVRMVDSGLDLRGFGVETVAGGSRGNEDGPVEEASFDSPMGLAAGAGGTLYVADTRNHRVREIAPEGTVSTLAGGEAGFADGSLATARFNAPRGVALLGGAIVVADTGNNAIRRILPGEDRVETIAGSRFPGADDGTGSGAGFRAPGGVAIDLALHIVVADTGNHCIRRIDMAGTVSTLAGTCGTPGFADGPGGRFDRPAAVAVDPRDGSILVADTGNHAIRRVTPWGTVETLAGNGEFGRASGVGPGARFDEPMGLAADNQGNVLVADTGNHLLRLLTPDRRVRTVAGSGIEGNADGSSGDAEFGAPAGLAVTGGVWVLADSRNHRVRRVHAR